MALIGRPVKYWPHYTAIIKETKTGQRWAVDAWIGDTGPNPSIHEARGLGTSSTPTAFPNAALVQVLL